jgi:hypothetical protein
MSPKLLGRHLVGISRTSGIVCAPAYSGREWGTQRRVSHGPRGSASEWPILDGGTDGSNPVPSSGESAANSIFEIPGLLTAIKSPGSCEVKAEETGGASAD